MNTAILITKPEFEAIIEGAVKKALREAGPSYVHPADKLRKQESELLTQAEACKLLKISRPTLISLRKRGAIQGRDVAGRILYKRSDLLAYVDSLPAKDSSQHPNLER